MSAIAGKTIWLRLGLLAAMALGLVWLVLTKSLAAYFAQTAPEIALTLHGEDAKALVQLANAEMKRRELRKAARQVDGYAPAPLASLEVQPDTLVKQWAQRALRKEPLSARALRILGQLAEKKGGAQSRKETESLMKTALRLSKRESVAAYWLASDSVARKEFGKAVSYIDMLLRSHPFLTKHAMQMLVRIAQEKHGRAKLLKVFANKPRWRPRFFRELRRASMLDARMPLLLLLDLQNTSAPPTTIELGHYLRFLIKQKLYQLAYYSWLQFLPREQLEGVGALFDGSFNFQPDNLPFGWRLPHKSRAEIKIAGRPGQIDNPALSVEFGYGHAAFGRPQQMTILTPGRYLFKGSLMGTLKGRRGLLWRIVCVGGAKAVRNMLGPMFVGRQQKWKNFEFSFKIPEQDCPAQQVQLVHDARTKSERLVSGHVWYDDLKISRLR